MFDAAEAAIVGVVVAAVVEAAVGEVVAGWAEGRVDARAGVVVAGVEEGGGAALAPEEGEGVLMLPLRQLIPQNSAFAACCAVIAECTHNLLRGGALVHLESGIWISLNLTSLIYVQVAPCLVAGCRPREAQARADETAPHYHDHLCARKPTLKPHMLPQPHLHRGVARRPTSGTLVWRQHWSHQHQRPSWFVMSKRLC
jgi:hypothetical protein